MILRRRFCGLMGRAGNFAVVLSLSALLLGPVAGLIVPSG
jgi:hypothetical protein